MSIERSRIVEQINILHNNVLDKEFLYRHGICRLKDINVCKTLETLMLPDLQIELLKLDYKEKYHNDRA